MTPEAESARTMLDEALDYLRLGYPVFPVCSPLMGQHSHGAQRCTSPGKRPLVAWEPYQSRLPTEQEVRLWWGRQPLANIGMATGALSGVVVLDCDSGEARQLAMERGGVDRTPAVWTGKPGGIHLWLEHPGEEVRNFARRLPGTDLRGDGGYVLLPPSKHVLGAHYRWAEATVGMKPASIPGWLWELLRGGSTAGSESNEGVGDPLDLGAILDGIGEGARDDTLWRYACKLRGDNVPQAYAEQLIRQAAALCRPPFDAEAAVEKVRRAYQDFQPRTDFGAWDEEIKTDPGAEEQASATPKVFLRPISELLAMEETEPDWMVENLFTAGSSGWIGAEPKVGKSWTVLELIYALTTGTPFLGRFDVPKPRRVVYIQEEDSLQRVLRRFKQLLRGTPDRIHPSDDFLKWSIRVGFKIDNSICIDILREELGRFQADVVVFDVFNRLHQKNENDQAEMSALLDTLMTLTREFGCAFIVVHHNRKSQPGGEARPNQLLRGSGVLAGWSECSLYLRKSKQKGTFIVVPESKDAPEIDEFSVTLVDTENGGVVLEIGEVTLGDRVADMQAKIIRAIEGLADERIDATLMRIADKVDASRMTVSRYIKDLVEAGIVKEDEVKMGKTYAKFFTL